MKKEILKHATQRHGGNKGKNRKLVKTFVFFVPLCLISFANAQSITPFVINSTGGSFSNNGVELSFNMGEVATTTIGSGSKLITQGFLQTENGTVSGMSSHTKNPYKIVAYPNPANEFLFIETNHPNVTRMTLTDFAGKVISSTPFAEKTELSTLSMGLYLVRLTDKNGNLLYTFKISKI